MAAQSRTKICTEDDETNSSIGITKLGKISYQWRPTTRNVVDQSAENNLESTLPSIFTQKESKAAQVDTKYISNLNTTVQVEKVAPMTLTNGDKVRTLTPDDTEKKLMEKMESIKISSKSKETTDAGDTTWLPQMDGIDVVLPFCSQTTNQSLSDAAIWTTADHEVRMADEMLKTEKYINFVLYGPKKSKRLPIFKEICPDDKED